MHSRGINFYEELLVCCDEESKGLGLHLYEVCLVVTEKFLNSALTIKTQDDVGKAMWEHINTFIFEMFASWPPKIKTYQMKKSQKKNQHLRKKKKICGKYFDRKSQQINLGKSKIHLLYVLELFWNGVTSFGITVL